MDEKVSDRISTLSIDDVRLSQLAACQKRIAELEAQLEVERNLRDSLLKELSDGSNSRPFVAFPNEILVQIFESLVEDDSLAIRPILFVCRKWYHLAMDREPMWARISIHPPLAKTLDYMRAWPSYAEQALIRSGEHLLDISIDLRDVPPLDMLAFTEIAPVLLKDPSFDQSEFWAEGWKYHSSPNRSEMCTVMRMAFDIFLQCALSPTDKGFACYRWHTFTLKASPRLLSRSDNRVWEICGGIFSMYRVGTLERVDLLDYDVRYVLEVPKGKHLLIHSKFITTTRHHYLGVSETLQMRVDSPFPDLCAAVNLRRLSIELTEELAPDTVPLIQLPSLHHLTVWGPSAQVVLNRLRAPPLRSLKLIGKQAILSVLQSAQPLNTAHVCILAAEADAPIVDEFMANKITDNTAVTCIAVMPWHVDAVTERVRVLQNGGLSTEKQVQTLEWSLRDANSEKLEENLWRSEESSLRYKTHHVS